MQMKEWGRMRKSSSGGGRAVASTAAIVVAYVLLAATFVLRLLQAGSHGQPAIIAITLLGIVGVCLVVVLVGITPLLMRNRKLRVAHPDSFLFTALRGIPSSTGISPDNRVAGKQPYSFSRYGWVSIQVDSRGIAFWNSRSASLTAPEFFIESKRIEDVSTVNFLTLGKRETGIRITHRDSRDELRAVEIRPASRVFGYLSGVSGKFANRLVGQIAAALVAS
jgi:hypothetical protein